MGGEHQRLSVTREALSEPTGDRKRKILTARPLGSSEEGTRIPKACPGGEAHRRIGPSEVRCSSSLDSSSLTLTRVVIGGHHPLASTYSGSTSLGDVAARFKGARHRGKASGTSICGFHLRMGFVTGDSG